MDIILWLEIPIAMLCWSSAETALASQPKTLLTPEEYLEIERKAEYKSEYSQGEMFAMAGASDPHNVLAGNLFAALHAQLRRRPCRVYKSDMRVRVSPTRLYTYPDVAVVCGQPQFADETADTLLNPGFIAEVLSPSTEGYDRGRKFEYYRGIESLAEYLLVAQDRVHVDLHTRQPDGRWVLSEASRLEDTLDLQSIGCQVALADLYEKVDLTASASSTPP
jgi:Uma2 family endonuclease